ncbi:MAG: hypothetical protein ACR2K2_07115 [Mycobacteriales bacterium]
MTGLRPLLGCRALLTAVALLSAACSSGASTPSGSDQPATEPTAAPPVTGPVPGRLIQVGTGAEGVVVSSSGVAAVLVRDPNVLALVDLDTGTVRQRVPLPSAGRHLGIEAPDGPVLVPLEDADTLLFVDPSSGEITRRVEKLTRNPHDAAPLPGGVVGVTDELGGGMYFLPAGGGEPTRLAGPRQPGGVTGVGPYAVAIDVRGGGIRVYDPSVPKQLVSAPLGTGLTHLVTVDDSRVAVADTEAGRVLIEQITPELAESVSLPAAGRPYGLAVDQVRHRLYVTLSARNQVLVYDTRLLSNGATPLGTIATVQQPYTLATDPRNGDLVVAGQATGVLQVIPYADVPGTTPTDKPVSPPPSSTASPAG